MNNIKYRNFQLSVVALEFALYSYYYNKEKGRNIHSSIGHEITAYLLTSILNVEDASLMLYYRSHAWLLGLGISFKEIINEIKGNKNSLQKGQGGTMNLFLHPSIIDCNSIIGAQIPIAVGAAFANKTLKKQTICVLGDGATNTGVFFESLNIVSLYKLPILFIIENNEIAINTSYSKTSAIDIKAKFELFSITCFEVSLNSGFETTSSIISDAIVLSKTRPVSIIFQLERIGAHTVSMERNFDEIINKYNLSANEKLKFNVIYEECKTLLNTED
ncbi:MAG: hypothetical protein HXX09_10950 [Bacteroidetes bacterium]|nr:hypothetical protein [Bacteroidota bacterium]